MVRVPQPLLTVDVALLGCGGDPLALDLDVFPTGAAVELVDPDLSAAQLVRRRALRPHMLLKIRRRVILPLFMQKGKIEDIIVLLVWGRKLRPPAPSQQVSPPPLTCAWHHSTRSWMDLQNSAAGLESAAGNLARAHRRRVRGSHVHAALLHPLHDPGDLSTRWPDPAKLPRCRRKAQPTCPSRPTGGSGRGCSGCDHRPEPEGGELRSSEPTKTPASIIHEHLRTFLSWVRVDLLGSLSGLKSPGSQRGQRVPRSLPEARPGWVGTGHF